MTTMMGLVFFYCLLIIAIGSYTSPSQSLNFTLNSNLIINPSISTPVISPLSSVKYSLTQAGWTTKKQYVQYVDLCLQQSSFSCTFQGITCGWQFLDTDSGSKNEQYYQNFMMTAGQQYQLKVDWVSEFPPLLLMLLTTSTGFRITWNGATVYTQYNIDCTLYTSTFYLISVEGTNELVIQGQGLVDGYGILIRNIQLKQLVYDYGIIDTTNSTSNTTNSTSSEPSNSTSNTTDTTNTTNTTNTSNTSNNSNTANDSNISDSVKPALSFDDLEQEINGSEYKNVFQVIKFMQQFSISKTANEIFASKQNVRFLLGLILEFNHLLLYNYHLLNATVMSNVILSGLQALDDQKGDILDDYIYPFIGTSPSDIGKGFEQQNNLPVNMNNVVGQYSQRAGGMLVLIMDTLWLDLPSTLIIFAVGFVLFKLLFKWKISLLFRQYSILGCLVFVLLDGKIEIASFHFLSEVFLLTPIDFRLKLKTVAIIFYYFLLFTLAIASTLLSKAIYTKLLKYVYDNCKDPHTSALHMCMNFGIFNILLGFTHRILLHFPLLQLYTLILIEVVYLIYLLRFLFRGRFDSSSLGATLCAMNFTRLCFIITFVVFEFYPDLQYDISMCQQYIFFSFIALWTVSSLICLTEKLSLIYAIIASSCKSHNKITPMSPSKNDSYDSPQAKLKSSRKTALCQKSQKMILGRPGIRILNFENKEVKIDLKKRLKSVTPNKLGVSLEEEYNSRAQIISTTSRKPRILNAATHKSKFTYLQK